ncbi:MAG TPA: HEAT repeat domain-containing protein [Tepidisphaeraceae bacterium]|jgi:hypothetical protein
MIERYAALLTATALAGGCSMFSSVPDDAVALAPPGGPTTMPSNEGADLTSAGGIARETFIDFPARIIEMVTGRTATDAVRRMEDSSSPDRRRDGIVELAERPYGRGEPYTSRYLQIAQFDADPMVRASAIRALNRSRSGGATDVFVAGLKDADGSVRLESAKALANIPDEKAVDPLLTVLGNATEEIDVRIAAADALRHYRRESVSKALIGLLAERDFGLAWQARQSLRYMTGDDHRFDSTAWASSVSGQASGG